MFAAAAPPAVASLALPAVLPRAPLRCRWVTPCVTAAPAPAPSPRREDSLKITQVHVQAMRSSEESNSDEDDEILSELKEKWDAIENKSSVLVYGGGAIIAVWLSLIVVKALDSVPLLPNILELVGLGYSGWFVYRYLLFKENREELVNGFDALKKRITGDEE
ncbi:protein CURVATURE THYLAKOID 1A, chloroplastic-like [Oryza brachyantha]|uniref:protein CURVATURE THYLAKOID 1A, chloroplastic-like n=1 Tax=Oryza brachyantha TaxID=4533 RepID=UPI00077686C3|nr:protein CURVATURE THYLAKOID 1A, chloroplastic-like [Oryza brachyantha]XP_006659423.2 protein CURVATURE THYLAKOID 1A, chloroplastic-like [Oryza brachyantha]XP_015695938.1 protein CURVATURE THYLAKOID 1A, chloroplastic-like [Oryza brachyantha]